MKREIYSSLGLDVKINIPETIDEYNELAVGRSGNAVLEDAIGQVIAHSTLGDFRKAFVAALVEKTKIPLKTKVVGKNADGTEKTEVDETEKEYFQRVCATEEKNPEDYQSIADEVADKIKFDPSKTARAAGKPKVTPEKYLAAADKILAAGSEAAARAAGRLAEAVGEPVEVTRESLGRALHLHSLAELAKARKAAEAASGALLAGLAS